MLKLPRIVFENYDQLFAWAQEFLKPDPRKYVIYMALDNEIILEPRKSTRPIRYGYLKSMEAVSPVKKMAEDFNVSVFNCKDYEWDLTKAPGVKVVVEG